MARGKNSPSSSPCPLLVTFLSLSPHITICFLHWVHTHPPLSSLIPWTPSKPQNLPHATTNQQPIATMLPTPLPTATKPASFNASTFTSCQCAPSIMLPAPPHLAVHPPTPTMLPLLPRIAMHPPHPAMPPHSFIISCFFSLLSQCGLSCYHDFLLPSTPPLAATRSASYYKLASPSFLALPPESNLHPYPSAAPQLLVTHPGASFSSLFS